MTRHKFTHTGWIRSEFVADYEVKLRRTKLYWVSDKKIKYRTECGRRAGPYTLSSMAMAKLDLTSIKEIPQ